MTDTDDSSGYLVNREINNAYYEREQQRNYEKPNYKM